MEITIEQQVIETIRVLPEEKQKEVLEYAKQISKTQTEDNSEGFERPKKRKFVQKIEELMKKLPNDAWDDSPTDGSLNHDHYLYGAPKRNEK